MEGTRLVPTTNCARVLQYSQTASDNSAAMLSIYQYIDLSSLQKAVRVTTLMKRLRAPEQSDSGASSPAAGPSSGPGSTAAPPAQDPEGVPSVTEASASIQAPDTLGSSAVTPEPSQPSPALPEAGPLARCNGDAPLQTSPPTQEDQNG